MNNLTVRYGEENFNVNFSTNNADSVEKLIKSSTAYKHGTYDSASSTIECRTKNDFTFCRKKAKQLGLIPIANHTNLKCS